MAIQSLGKADLNDIRRFEFQNEIKLPNDYVEFLLNYNGGILDATDENSFFIEDLGECVNIDVLFGINTKEVELGVELWLNDYRNDMPRNTIILGTSYQHGFIILICAGDDSGVYYWDHAFEFSQSNDDENTYFMFDTFQDFAKGFL